MEDRSGKIVIVAAIIANLVVMVSKYVAAAVTGSSAMISEAIHSSVDTLDGIFLLIGKKRSRRPADGLHPFGYGKSLYFWTFMVSVFIFSVGGGMSVYEGITHLIHPHKMVNITWNYAVLGIAFVSESVSFSFALRELRTTQNGKSIWQTIRSNKDPTAFTVLLEDSAALIGLTFAFLGIVLGHRYDAPWLDGAASLMIGLTLIVTALILARESGNLLLGESIAPDQLVKIRSRIRSTHGITRVQNLLTMHLGPHDVLLTLDVILEPGMDSETGALTIERLEQSLRSEFPDLKRIFIETIPTGCKSNVTQ